MREAVTIAARLLTTVLLLALTASAVSAVDETNYPSKQIRIIVGFATGGAPDALARIIGDRLMKKWGQAVVVKNRTGANGKWRRSMLPKQRLGSRRKKQSPSVTRRRSLPP